MSYYEGKASGAACSNYLLQWSMEIDPMTGKASYYAQVSGAAARVRYMSVDLDALIARLVAMKNLGEQSEKLLGGVKEK